MTDIFHYGTKRHSGRYPWGSGKKPYQSSSSFLEGIAELRKQGLTDAQIAEGLGLRSSTQLQAFRRIALNEAKALRIAKAVRLKEKNYSNMAIGRAMGINESTVRGLLAQHEKSSFDTVNATVNRLREEVETKGAIDVGMGIESRLGVNSNTVLTSLEMLYAEGYRRHNVKVPQVGIPGQFTTVKVLAKPEGEPGQQWKDLYDHPEKIKLPETLDVNSDTTRLGIIPPKSLSSDRMMIRYGPEGGSDKDGVIELRRGVDDLSMGHATYAQVRIAVDGTHFIKGMAVYNDDMPKGVDVIFNTNKDRGTPKDEVLKVMKSNKFGIIDDDNPFGSSIAKQFTTKDKNGKEVVTSVVNIVNEEGDWGDWARTLSSQMLSKQSPALAKSQLEVVEQISRASLDEIKELTNPTVKKKLLESFADSADSAAVHLKAAAMPRQTNSVIIPINSLKDTEIYAPNYKQGERVVLIRHPHGGKFEIPELTVNIRNKEAKGILGSATDAVGINAKVASQLSGADFDGDTVLVIPNPRSGPNRITTRPPLADLKNFNPRTSYPGYDGMKVLSDGHKQKLMGDVSNLITDMSIKGANESEIAQAVRHSMVVIDAEKHKLNYKASADANGISALKAKYQEGGASTLISRASSDERVPARTPRRSTEGGPIDPVTGEKVWTTKPNNTWTKTDPETGVKTLVSVPPPKLKSTKMAETKDARTLVSNANTQIEAVYATHANQMKAMANEARKELVATKDRGYSPSARKAYHVEEARLTEALVAARKNAPLERQAQILANQVIRTKRDENPQWDPDDIKKARGQALRAARARTGAGKDQIVISDREWEAIQAGAVSPSKLSEILKHADLDRVKELATPRTTTGLPPAKLASARGMLARGFTQAEVAEMLGVSVSTIARALKG